MYVVVTYDCRSEKTRRKVRSLLRKYSFTMLTYSVYVGRGSRGVAERIATLLSRVLDECDRATVMLLNDFQYEILMEVTRRNVSIRGEEIKVIVFFGRGRTDNKVANEDTGRPKRMRNESEVAEPNRTASRTDRARGGRKEVVE